MAVHGVVERLVLLCNLDVLHFSVHATIAPWRRADSLELIIVYSARTFLYQGVNRGKPGKHRVGDGDWHSVWQCCRILLTGGGGMARYGAMLTVCGVFYTIFPIREDQMVVNQENTE